MGKYPAWLDPFRQPGLHFRKNGNQYYAYRRIVPGGEEQYIGVVTPQGIRMKDHSTEVASAKVCEYGFSRAVHYLCPSAWKNRVRGDWEMILDLIISGISPNSYRLRDRMELTGAGHYPGMQQKALNRMLPVPLEELYNRLHGVIIVFPADGKPIVYTDSVSQEYAASIGITFEEF